MTADIRATQELSRVSSREEGNRAMLDEQRRAVMACPREDCVKLELASSEVG